MRAGVVCAARAWAAMVAGQLTPPGLGLCASDSGCVSWNFATWVSMFLSGAFLRVCLAMRILHFMSRVGSVWTRVVCLGSLLLGLSIVLSGASLRVCVAMQICPMIWVPRCRRLRSF